MRSRSPDFRRVRMIVVAMGVERLPRRIERLAGPTQIARDQRDLCLGDDASRTRYRFLRPESTRGSFHETFCACEIAELGHCDTA